MCTRLKQVTLSKGFTGSAYFSIRNSTREAFDLGNVRHTVVHMLPEHSLPSGYLCV